MLRIVEPFIAYGYPNLKSVRELIYKRGYGKMYVSSRGVVMSRLTLRIATSSVSLSPTMP
jgi:hypothetical protein